MIDRADPEVVKAMAREAKGLLDDRAFTTAIRTLHLQALGELISGSPNVERKESLIAELRVLEAIPRRLASMMHDGEFAQGGGHAAGRR
jgi:hypothetical protein